MVYACAFFSIPFNLKTVCVILCKCFLSSCAKFEWWNSQTKSNIYGTNGTHMPTNRRPTTQLNDANEAYKMPEEKRVESVINHTNNILNTIKARVWNNKIAFWSDALSSSLLLFLSHGCKSNFPYKVWKKKKSLNKLNVIAWILVLIPIKT